VRRFAVPLALLVLVVGGFVVAEALSGKKDASKGRAAPALPAKALSGDRVTLASLKGRPAIVHFWASWCGPCLKEAPELAALPAALGGRASVVGVDWSDNPSHAVAFVRKHGWRFPILQDHDGTVGNRYRLAGLPTTFLLDRNGRIVKQLTGPQTRAGLLADIKPLENS
jgi:cytochrome c biogenesis protein CcmG, thiol:disulfide interchange protein DsbE